MAQLILWWFPHLAGEYGEGWLFIGYYFFGGLLLFGVADRFRTARRGWNVVLAALSCLCAVVLPGVVCTAWYRAIYVDLLMAMLFGLILTLTVYPNEAHPGFRKVGLLILAMCLTLVKSIGILWAVLALGFWYLWWRKERGAGRFALLWGGMVLLCRGSWWVFCRVMERSTALVDSFYDRIGPRLRELADGVFLTSGNNRGYLVSYAKAFLVTPMHRESTAAIDLAPAALVVLLFLAALLLWRLGFVPKKKLGRLLVFMTVTLGLIYLVLMVGQLTMFYTETKYLEPVHAVTLMTRYCAPAHMGLLILLCAFAAGGAAGADPALPRGRRVAALAVTGALLLSCGGWREMYRRFCYDELDGQRLELRESFCTRYADFLAAVRAVPLDQSRGRVLLCIYQSGMNPIVINEASPVSFLHHVLSGDGAADAAAVTARLKQTHAGYLYVDGCPEDFLEALSALAGGEIRTGALYPVDEDGRVVPEPVEAE